VAPSSPRVVLRDLIREIDLYLAAHPGAGVAETRIGIASLPNRNMVHAQRGPNIGLPPKDILRDVTMVLGILETHQSALAYVVRAALRHLTWYWSEVGTFDGSDPFSYAYAPLIGANGPISSHDLALGLMLIAPHGMLGFQSCAASTLYAPVTGPHGWRFAPNQPLSLKPAHRPIWIAPNHPHLIKVGPDPFLAIRCLHGNIATLPKPIAADDWQRVEQVRR
jgi:hypothetical protein